MQTIIDALKQIAGEANVITSPALLAPHQTDASERPGGTAWALVAPGSTEEVAAILRLANEHRIPVTARGAGTGLSGGAIPVQGGILLSLARLNRILEIDQANLLARVEAGVITGDLQAAVESVGLFYPPDPASKETCTIGGNIAENAGGPRCFKYGVTRSYVLGLTAVLPTGEIVRTGGLTVKNRAGFDLTGLLVGSEGMLGIVTEATLRLVPKPEAAETFLAAFDSLEGAAEWIRAVVAAGVVPATLELMDRTAAHLIEARHGLGLNPLPEAILLVEVDGLVEAVERQASEVAALLAAHGARLLRREVDPAKREELWAARRTVGREVALQTGHKVGEDIVVPIAAIPAVVRELQQLGVESGFPIVVFGHAGDGNLHPNLVADLSQPGVPERVKAVTDRMLAIALAHGGTISAEHGIGHLKAHMLERAVGPAAMQAMRAIKMALDPNGVLNPGKLALGTC
jgi:glycolate oxidase